MKCIRSTYKYEDEMHTMRRLDSDNLDIFRHCAHFARGSCGVLNSCFNGL